MFAERFEIPQSLEYIERAATSFPLASPVWTTWGGVLEDAGREDEAIRRYRRAFELDDQNVAACSRAAYLLLLQGDLDQARRYYLMPVSYTHLVKPMDGDADQVDAGAGVRGGAVGAVMAASILG